MSLYFECAGLSYELQGQVPSFITEDIAAYLTEERTPESHEINCLLKYVSDFEPVGGVPVYQNSERLILDNNGKECRIHFKNGSPISYYKEINDAEVEIQIIEHVPAIINMQFLEHFALERHLLKLNGYILHACVVKYNGEAIVFTAPSGTGKSTQGNLWGKYKGAELINGDRCIIQKRGDRFFACGLPFCGSSTVNKNEIIPLRAIVVLSQAPEDCVEVLNPASAVKKIVSETSINYWNPEFVNQMISLISVTANDVPIVKFACTPTENAVKVLDNYLFKQCKWTIE